MRKRNKIICIGLVGVALIAAYVYFTQYANPQTVAGPAAAFKVTAAPVIQKNLPIPVQAIGTVQAYSTITVQSMVDGQLLQVGFKEGDFVKKGQLLFSIDPRPFIASLNQAIANLDRDKALLLNAQLQVNRNKALIKVGYISKQDFDQLVANSASAEATVEGDKAAINNAELNLAYTKISSPISGHTGSLQVNLGNIIKTASNTVLVTITQIEPIYISFSVPQQYLAAIQAQNQKGPITVSAEVAGKIEQGKLSFIDNTVDSSTGTIALKSVFANTDHALWPGEFINVTLPSTVMPDALIIPTLAVQAGQNGSFVYVVKPDSTVVYQSIVTGPMVGSDTVVVKGLTAGQQVVLDGQLRLMNGSRVTVITNPTPAASGS